MAYQPRQFNVQAPQPVADWAGQVVRWVFGELTQLARDRNAAQDYVMLKTLYAAPARLQEGMVVKADGVAWNPGGGAGIYAYVSSAWVKLN